MNSTDPGKLYEESNAECCCFPHSIPLLYYTKIIKIERWYAILPMLCVVSRSKVVFLLYKVPFRLFLCFGKYCFVVSFHVTKT